MPTRRLFLATALAAGISPPAAGVSGAGVPGGGWQGWRDHYVCGGRVIDWQQQGISHSEGQGYGLLLAQAAGDRASFELIEGWTQANLDVRQDRLMAWRWQPDDGRVARHNATDGDLFRAWALLRAHRDSGWSGHLDTAFGIARDIARLCLAPDPRAPAEWLLLPGAEARRAPGRVLFNPSYIMPRALRELGEAADETLLIRAADHGETVLAELADAGQLWDWVDVTASGFAPPRVHRPVWGYDALRIPLYLAWSGRTGHPATAAALRNLTEGAQDDHVVVMRSEDGRPEAQSDHPGFTALPRLAHCAPLPEWLPDGRNYYPDTLLALCRIAFREGGCVL